MIVGIGMPGGSEWIFIFIALITLFIAPILTIVFYIRNRELRRQVKTLTEEKNGLLVRLLDK